MAAINVSPDNGDDREDDAHGVVVGEEVHLLGDTDCMIWVGPGPLRTL